MALFLYSIRKNWSRNSFFTKITWLIIVQTDVTQTLTLIAVVKYEVMTEINNNNYVSMNDTFYQVH